ncbi:hypothetical protein ACFQ38_07195, partial [Sporosarcina contaminans]
ERKATVVRGSPFILQPERDYHRKSVFTDFLDSPYSLGCFYGEYWSNGDKSWLSSDNDYQSGDTFLTIGNGQKFIPNHLEL